VSFYLTELPQYALIEAVRGLSPDVVHLAGAMTYVLVLLLAAWLAKGGASGRAALGRLLVVAFIILAPAPGADYTLLMSPDHYGSTVPVLLAWLAVDRLPDSAGTARWYRPVAVGLLLTWGQVSDSLILVTGVAPIVVAAGSRAGVRFWRRDGGAGDAWLAAAAIISTGLARAVMALIRAAGGYQEQAVGTTFSGLGALPHHLALTAQGLLTLFGADFFSPQSGPDLAFAALHLIGVAAVAVALVLALAQLGRAGDLVVPGLAVAIVFNLVTFVPSLFVQDLKSAREISAVVPFGAILAARLLTTHLRPASPVAHPHTALPATKTSRVPSFPRAATLTLAALTAGVLVFAAELGYQAAQPSAPAQNQSLADWLVARHLTAGLAPDYWVANATTVASGGRVTVRQVAQSGQTLYFPQPRELNSGWYTPARHDPRFVAVDLSRPNAAAYLAAAAHTFGAPAQTLHPAGYTVLVWPVNLLTKLQGTAPAASR
jgi:hypothetical protein